MTTDSAMYGLTVECKLKESNFNFYIRKLIPWKEVNNRSNKSERLSIHMQMSEKFAHGN